MTIATPSSFGDFRLGDWVVQPRLNRISRGRSTVALELKAMRALVCLAEHKGELVTRRALIDAVWPTAYIADNTLNHVVRDLRKALGDDARNPEFIETIHRRGYRLVAKPAPVSDEESSISRTLSHYLLLEHLGGGGMGVVYRAEDTNLGREVVLKFLPKDMSRDPEARERFRREARAASAFDHPNICTIHEINETAEGQLFIAMALYDGETLKKKIERGPLEAGDAVRIARQIADGLESAHGGGVIHRDIKPANVMITAEGSVKILDFGLARVIQGIPRLDDESAEGVLATSPGTVIGTTAYMAPEQVRGEAADHRSDIFSLGVVLYEMLSGKHPFGGATTMDTAAAILKQEPPELSSVGAAVASELEHTVRRCLKKKPEERYQSASDLAESLRRSSTPGSAPEVAAAASVPVKGRPSTLWIAISAAFLIVVTALGWFSVSQRKSTKAPLRTVPLTSFPGEEIYPAISPDGDMLAFVRRGDSGTLDLFVSLVGGGDPLRVSDGISDSWTPCWSPDGRRVAFYRGLMNKENEYSISVDVVPALGGQRRQLTATRARPVEGLSWSLDGSSLAFVDTDEPGTPGGIFLLSLETGEKRRLTTPPADHVGDFGPQFSPDGRSVAFVRQRQLESTAYIVEVEGGKPRMLVAGNTITGLDWTPNGREIIFSDTRQGTPGFASLWRIPSAGGDPEMLPVGEEGTYLALSRRHAAMCYQRTTYRVDLWRVAGPSAEEQNEKPTRFIASSTYNNGPRYSSDGAMIAFASQRSGFVEVWVCDREGKNPTQFTHLENLSGMPSWSPDSRRIAFTSDATGNLDIYVMSSTGGVPRRLTDSDADDGMPTWSGDGRGIYFSSNRGGIFQLYRMPSDGGEAIQITTEGGYYGIESPDGGFLYFTKRRFWEGPHGIWRIAIEGGPEVKIHHRGEGISWDIFDRGICYLNLQSDPRMVEFLDLDTGEVRQISEVEGATMWGFGMSPDGRWVIFQRQEREADIMLVENFR